MNTQEDFIKHLVSRYPVLNDIFEDIQKAYGILEECFSRDGKLLVAGNGGSAADSEHIAGELMKSFRIPRPIDTTFAERLVKIDSVLGKELACSLEQGLAVIPLVTHEALSTAYCNDVNGEGVFAQQLLGFGRPGDVFLGISTSGNSKNILLAAITAKALGLKVIGLTGANGGKLLNLTDVCIKAPSTETYMIQELHLPIYHCLCMMLERSFFGTSK